MSYWILIIVLCPSFVLASPYTEGFAASIVAYVSYGDSYVPEPVPDEPDEPNEEFVVCPDCNGVGRLGGVLRGRECPRCEGTGKIRKGSPPLSTTPAPQEIPPESPPKKQQKRPPEQTPYRPEEDNELQYYEDNRSYGPRTRGSFLRKCFGRR